MPKRKPGFFILIWMLIQMMDPFSLVEEMPIDSFNFGEKIFWLEENFGIYFFHLSKFMEIFYNVFEILELVICALCFV